MPAQPSEVGETLTASVGLCPADLQWSPSELQQLHVAPEQQLGWGPDQGARRPSHMHVGREPEETVHQTSGFAMQSY